MDVLRDFFGAAFAAGAQVAKLTADPHQPSLVYDFGEERNQRNVKQSCAPDPVEVVLALRLPLRVHGMVSGFVVFRGQGARVEYQATPVLGSEPNSSVWEIIFFTPGHAPPLPAESYVPGIEV